MTAETLDVVTLEYVERTLNVLVTQGGEALIVPNLYAGLWRSIILLGRYQSFSSIINLRSVIFRILVNVKMDGRDRIAMFANLPNLALFCLLPL